MAAITDRSVMAYQPALLKKKYKKGKKLDLGGKEVRNRRFLTREI
jgi:hypothetical protein